MAGNRLSKGHTGEGQVCSGTARELHGRGR